jgi:UDP-N-acetylglucosamine--N-acetylmuramyl-(pentapeptide) pyrophosphoryl-undecaprenol N-acetylglucosamine transferase
VNRRSIVIGAGGTGGHIYPGLALAAAIGRLAPDTPIRFVGTPRGLERTLVPAAGYPLDLVDMVPFVRGQRSRLPWRLIRSVAACGRILRRERAAVAVGMGGYAGVPLVLAGRLIGLPTLVHESGAIPGRANRLAARFARTVAVAFDSAGPRLRRDAQVVGMPLLPELAGFDRPTLRPAARRALGVGEDVVVVLVNGGSQGARRLNELTLELADRWSGRGDVLLLLKTGPANYPEVAARAAALGSPAVLRVVAQFDRMPDVYAAADVAVCRAGAGTVAELAVAGLPAVLIPYPYAAEAHQQVNAETLSRAGAAVVLPESDADVDRLAALLDRLIRSPGQRAEMAAAGRRSARPDAADVLARMVLALADGAVG